MNQDTITIDYNIRFMISDNTLYPKTYEVTKVMDTFPLGSVKVILKQDHYNQHTDLCGIDETHKYFDDNSKHMICDFYKSSIIPCSCDDEVHYLSDHENKDETIYEDSIWKLSEVNECLYVNGQPQIIYAFNDDKAAVCEWKLYIDNEEVISKLDSGYVGKDTFIDDINRYLKGESSSYYLQDYFEINLTDTTLSIRAINKDMVNYIIKIAVRDKNKTYSNWKYDDFVEMEVTI